MRRSRWWVIALITAITAAITAVIVMTGSTSRREAEVAAKGAAVMPFDLDLTTHRFTKGANGGVQTVVADDPSDVRQITLIREHLSKENDKFRRGDFGDPAAIHGAQMPGLTELSTGYARIATIYAELPDGARITYAAGDPALIQALHSWFDAQVSDHGNHAEHG